MADLVWSNRSATRKSGLQDLTINSVIADGGRRRGKREEENGLETSGVQACELIVDQDELIEFEVLIGRSIGRDLK